MYCGLSEVNWSRLLLAGCKTFAPGQPSVLSNEASVRNTCIMCGNVRALCMSTRKQPSLSRGVARGSWLSHHMLKNMRPLAALALHFTKRICHNVPTCSSDTHVPRKSPCTCAQKGCKHIGPHTPHSRAPTCTNCSPPGPTTAPAISTPFMVGMCTASASAPNTCSKKQGQAAVCSSGGWLVHRLCQRT